MSEITKRWGDLDPIECSKCVQNSVNQIGLVCPYSLSASLQLEGCYIRYEHFDFLGKLDTSLRYKKCNKNVVSNDVEFLRRRDDVLGDLQARRNSDFRVSNSGLVEGYAQCLGDLSAENCNSCMAEAVMKLTRFCGSAVSGDVFLGQCYARYWKSGHYNDDEPDSSNEDQVGKSIAIIVGVVLGLAILVVVLSICKNAMFWTENFVQWSPMDTYLATIHRQGAAVWGGATTFNCLMRYAHPQVKLIDFSPGEKYLVTYSRHEPSNPRDANRVVINIFDVRTGKVMRDFKGNANDFAIEDTGDTFSLVDKKSLKVESVMDFSWSPIDPILALFVPELGGGNQPARVISTLRIGASASPDIFLHLLPSLFSNPHDLHIDERLSIPLPLSLPVSAGRRSLKVHCVADNISSTKTNPDSLCLSNADLAALGEGIPRLERLRLIWCSNISSDSLKFLAYKCTFLKSLDLQGCFFGDQGLAAIGQCCKQLEDLNLRFCEGLKWFH
ncbi:hypothetical protein AHAS_Ahas02G0222100 [Arachis hypogaea]